MRKEPAKSGDEQDWGCVKSGRLLATYKIGSGKGWKIKRALNKRWRRRWKTTPNRPEGQE